MATRNELMQLVDSLDFFSGLSGKEKNTLLAIVEPHDYNRGAILCREGDRAFSFFVICRGKVEVLKELFDNNQELLGELGAGSMIGQVSLIDGKPRAATVRAKTRVTTLECSRDDFERLFNAGSPFAYKIMNQIIIHLTSRLREANQQLYNLYSRPTETLKKLRGLCLNIQRSISDTHDTGPVDVIGPTS
jgi:CRP-like cAMP-binding protein